MSRSSRGDVGFGSRQRSRKFTKPEIIAKVSREIKRRLIAAGQLADPSKQRPKMDWHWHYDGEVSVPDEQGVLVDVNGCGGVIAANTRSEAKAQLKKIFGNKLPANITIVGVVPDANSQYQPGPVAVSTVPAGSSGDDLRVDGKDGE